MKLTAIYFFISFIFTKANAQNVSTITFHIYSSSKNSYAVALKDSKDSSIVKLEHTNSEGAITFEKIKFGTYFLEIYYLNKLVHLSNSFSVLFAHHTLPNIDISDKAIQISEVKILAKKPIVEQQAGKLIYNVENTLEAPSNDALTVLQKAPGLSVDQNGNVSMRGKKGVNVMINGKMTYLSGAQLANLLRTTTANQISKIEIISNPSAKYDAEGNAGIVNIVLKKDQRLGTNGLIVLSGGFGQYHKSANGININSRGKKVNLFASFNYANKNDFNDLKLFRKFYKNQLLVGAYDQANYLFFPSQNSILKIGLDYTLNKKTTFGIVTSGFITNFNPESNNKTDVLNNNLERETVYTSSSISKEKYYNGSVNFSTKTILDSLGSEISSDIDYANYKTDGLQNYETHFYDLQNIPIKSPDMTMGSIDGNLDIKAGKIDVIKLFPNNIKLESGLKCSIVKADNDISFQKTSTGISIFDSTQSNHFIYKENINALYSSLSFNFKKTDFQLGLRMEQTVADGLQIINGQSFNRNYWQLFPTVFINRKLNESHDLGFSYSRRIQRPGYDLMNPVRLFIDATTYKVGNPYLIPQNSYIFELSHTLKQQYLTTFSATLINESITEVLIPDETYNNITIQTNKNINQQYIYSINYSIPISLKNWWKISTDATGYYSLYTGRLSNMDINSGVVSFNAKMMHNFTFLKSFSAQVDAFFQFKEHYSFSTIDPFGSVNISIQKTMADKRTSIKLSLNDVFYNSRFRGSSTYTNYQENFYVQRDSRSVILALTYRYGKTSVQGVRKRNTGADEEKQRAGKNV